MSRLARAGLLTAVTDGLFSSVLVVAAYGSTVTRLWQGVASVVLGPAAFDGVLRTVVVGLAMHVAVAFFWSAVFLFLGLRLGFVRRLLASRHGVVKVAAVYVTRNRVQGMLREEVRRLEGTDRDSGEGRG